LSDNGPPARLSLQQINEDVIACAACPRLVAWREQVAREKRAAYRDQTYWGRPVPSFGDPAARVLLCGLAPGAHGANRTGRMFTGDRSGDWLYGALHRAGFANQPTSRRRDDGLQLTDVYITAVVRCVPPDNKPDRAERQRCLPFLLRELRAFSDLRCVVCLGGIAWDGTLAALAQLGHRLRPKPRFAHGAEVAVGPYTLLGCYHVSQQNTFTGRLTEPMLDGVFRRARDLSR
jgi:uracil-DNA glycosylase family 4